MHIEFEKLHGAGNDFVMFEDMNSVLSIAPQQVIDICDRHFGVGADGVIVIKPSPRSECAAYMDYYNSDGTKAEMCGNGVRCFAKYLVDHNIVDPQAGSFVADTLAGPKPIEFTVDEQGQLTSATVDMGEPILVPSKVPTTLPSSDGAEAPVLNAPLCVGGELYSLTCVSMGNPHAIIFVDDPSAVPLEDIGPLIEVASEFPEKTNVEFASVSDDGITMRVWERGCGETLACGTGACATAVAACLTGRCGCKTILKLRGGILEIEWAKNCHVYMTGPAARSFTGSLEL